MTVGALPNDTKSSFIPSFEPRFLGVAWNRFCVCPETIMQDSKGQSWSVTVHQFCRSFRVLSFASNRPSLWQFRNCCRQIIDAHCEQCSDVDRMSMRAMFLRLENLLIKHLGKPHGFDYPESVEKRGFVKNLGYVGPPTSKSTLCGRFNPMR